MKLKKAAAIALAFATAAALSVPATAFAAGPEATIPGASNVTKEGDTAASTLTGTIKATTLSVSVPTAASFNVDPAHTVAAGEGGQFESPTNYIIANKSVVPIYAYISKVDVTDVNLVDTVANVAKATTVGGKDAKIQFAVKDAAPANFTTQTDWLTTTTHKYYAFGTGNTAGMLVAESTPPNPDPDLTSHPHATMKFYGQVAPENWKNGQTFTITPTFTVSANKPA